MVECGKSGWARGKVVTAATLLEVSIDYLYGLTDEPTPVAQLVRALAAATGGAGLDDPRVRAAALDDSDWIGVSELASAAGDGAVVDHERVTGRVKFRRDWLARHGLIARHCRVIQVAGESMEPTLVDGCAILVNQASRRRRVGRIFVIRTEDGLVVKRAGRDASGAWQLISDNPNTHVWPPRPWPPDAVVVGEVKWTARTLL